MLTRSRPTTEATIAALQGLPVEPARDTIVEARDLRKVYGAKVAVAGVSFGVRRGEIFGILGANGAGKSTVLELLEGLRDPNGGAAIIDGLDVRRAKRAVHARIGVQLQSTALFKDLSLTDNLRLLAALYRRSVPTAELLGWVNLAVGATLIAWRERGVLKRLAVTPLRPPTLLLTQIGARLAFSLL